MQNWQPSDILKLIALLGGFFLCALGAGLMWLGVGAEGTVDIKSSVLSGTVKTGSAGLFIIFFGFAIVLFVLASLGANASSKEASSSVRRSKSHTIGIAFFALLVALLVSAGLGAAGYGNGFGLLAAFLGVALIITGGAYVELASSEA